MLALPSRPNEGGDLTMAVLGCGNMGIAILSGILASVESLSGPKPLQTDPAHPPEEVPASLPTRFIACVRSTESAKRVKKALWQHTSYVKVVTKDNLAAVKRSEIILLACKPHAIKPILSEPGMAKALEGKLLISICAGITVSHIESILHGSEPELFTNHDDAEKGDERARCQIIRALANTASIIGEGMTVIADSNAPPPPEIAKLVTWIFRRIGAVVYLPSHSMDASTALVGSAPGFFSLVLEAAIDGAVAMGLPRAEATRMAAQSMRGTASMVLEGEHPATLRDRVATPGGCTIGGLMILEEGGVRGTISRAVRESATIASALGRGERGVNATRGRGDTKVNGWE
ncbi:pyrroline-5-carboxylate reductase [Truncatella angustata]|uniref:Pyrroline-5-carboxylate reductase n=1 Tax=Truncatella angustata TaxID=152316 RepID=A0A9P8UZY6_9PEZI|nr:pyrroline-5-carboxylate reductase [Truncatella angustata]KAH6661297.1 pyrroline-5-carboxylate reductase [Truncatella angustata]